MFNRHRRLLPGVKTAGAATYSSPSHKLRISDSILYTSTPTHKSYITLPLYRQNWQNVPEIGRYNLKALLLWIKKSMSTSSVVTLGTRAEENVRKMENQQLVPPPRQCSSTPVAFVQGFLTTEQCFNTGASPILSWPGCSWPLPVPSTEISTEGTTLVWCYRHILKCDVRAEKAFTKWLPGLFPAHLQLLAEVCRCTRGLFWVVQKVA